MPTLAPGAVDEPKAGVAATGPQPKAIVGSSLARGERSTSPAVWIRNHRQAAGSPTSRPPNSGGEGTCRRLWVFPTGGFSDRRTASAACRQCAVDRRSVPTVLAERSFLAVDVVPIRSSIAV